MAHIFRTSMPMTESIGKTIAKAQTCAKKQGLTVSFKVSATLLARELKGELAHAYKKGDSPFRITQATKLRIVGKSVQRLSANGRWYRFLSLDEAKCIVGIHG